MAKKKRGKSVPKFLPREGSRLSKRAVARLQPELEHLYMRDGCLTAESILGRAQSNKRSPLRKHFEWDDSIAAQLHRLEQARHLVRSIEIEVINPAPKPGKREIIRVRAWQSLPNEAKPGTHIYHPTSRVIEDPEMCQLVIDDAKQRLEYWQKTYQAYTGFARFRDEFFEVNEAIDRLLAGKRKRAPRKKASSRKTTRKRAAAKKPPKKAPKKTPPRQTKRKRPGRGNRPAA